MELSNNIFFLPVCFFALYLILEAQDIGLCLSAPFIAKNKAESKAVLGLLRPGADGNEIWLIAGLSSISLILNGVLFGFSGMVLFLLAIIILSALLRLVGALWADKFDSAMMIKLSGITAFVNIGAVTSIILSVIDESAFSVNGIFSTIWLTCSFFQIGTLYGALKMTNPLGERFRAASLVSSLFSLATFIIFTVVWYIFIESRMDVDMFFWGLVASALIFSVISFAATRTRNVGAGVICTYLAQLCAAAVYLLGIEGILSAIRPGIIGMGADGYGAEINVIIGIAAVCSAAAFAWRMLRHKETYEWKDHI